MGRRKLEMKRIEDNSARQVTFSKRRKGLLKKAKELSVLCDLDVALLIISRHGKLHHFSSNNRFLRFLTLFAFLTEILERYHSHIEAESSPSTAVCESLLDQYSGTLLFKTKKWSILFLKQLCLRVLDAVLLPCQVECSKHSRSVSCGELLQIVERDLEEPLVDQLSVTDLLHLENELQAALTQTRTTKTHLLLDSISSLHEKEKMLVEEKGVLEEKIGGSMTSGRTKKVILDLNIIPDAQMLKERAPEQRKWRERREPT
ncbi:agamous-like MADS-box protein AGL27 isoform X1 [Sesamum indicum]|uniref:Agamous-like MADS-box protein AGL27 isoform X1 n=1 Tax=Sesamum indicum TaxID=4182 RepID=A0A8M8UN77_SESIN|nr:agamous-like MADS-box protein AGL27 isoform X1 [Sesamum indicum]